VPNLLRYAASALLMALQVVLKITR